MKKKSERIHSGLEGTSGKRAEKKKETIENISNIKRKIIHIRNVFEN
jgi:hypothetical protein